MAKFVVVKAPPLPKSPELTKSPQDVFGYLGILDLQLLENDDLLKDSLPLEPLVPIDYEKVEQLEQKTNQNKIQEIDSASDVSESYASDNYSSDYLTSSSSDDGYSTENCDRKRRRRRPKRRHRRRTPSPPPPKEEEPQEDERDVYLRKLERLKKKYPDLDLPQLDDFAETDVIKKTFYKGLNAKKLEMSVSTYKIFLKFAFIASEYILTYFGLDAEGFASEQTNSMSSYEDLLEEIGEKNYSFFGSNLPAEARLFGLIIFNAAVFVGIKKFGPGLMGMMTTGNKKLSTTQKRGPRTTEADIKRMAEEN